MNLKKFILLISSLLIIIGAVLAFNFYSKIYKPSTVKEGFLFIPSNIKFDDIETLVRPFLKRVKPFLWVAELKKYDQNIKPGRYHILKDMSNNDLVNLLRSGQQSPINLSFNNQDDIEKLAGRIAVQIEADSSSLLEIFRDQDFLKSKGFTTKTALSMYIPNTYEFFWNTDSEKFRERMALEYERFWTTERLNKANSIGLNKTEVITLASIVQKETAKVSERKRVAGLYLNRLRENWPLQADPTIIFALKQKFGAQMTIKRVLTKDLQIASPYNTYKFTGLPPGPIAMPDISSIDAVLNAEKHKFFYMCASVDNIGEHEFATSLRQHNSNAAKYQRWISKRGIQR